MLFVHVSPTRRNVSTLEQMATAIRRISSPSSCNALVGVWSRAGCGNKINFLETMPFLPLAFRCQALYFIYVSRGRESVGRGEQTYVVPMAWRERGPWLRKRR
jgi:hypothetical protein